MNTMGKILVIINLVFALMTGGFLAMDFATRTNWRTEYEKLKEELTVSRNNTGTLQATTEMVVGKLKKEESRAKGLEKTLDQERRKHQQELEEVRGDLAKTKGQTDKTDLTSMIISAELEKLRLENKGLLDVISKRDKQIVQLNDDRNKFLDQVTQALNDTKQYADRSEALLERVRELEKWKANAQVTAAGGGTAGPAGPAIRDQGQANPPPAYVRGKVEKVDPVDRTLVQIDLGTDAGLSINNTLDVYRLSPRPEYLGMLRIVNAGHHTAIGRLLPSRTGSRSEVRAGDEVASSIQPPR
jgi:hypothetical protein